jgi:hypothetical protein
MPSLAGSVSARLRPERRRRSKAPIDRARRVAPLVPLSYFQLHRALTLPPGEELAIEALEGFTLCRWRGERIGRRFDCEQVRAAQLTTGRIDFAAFALADLHVETGIP